MSGRNRKILRDYGIAILAAVAIALLIRFFVLEAYRIPTAAMRPTLEPGDTIFVTKRPVGFDGKVERGDVVIFESPADPGRDYVKRVIGLPGDLVQVRKGRVSLNGKPLETGRETGKAPGKTFGGGLSGDVNAPCGKETLPGRALPYEVCWELPFLEDAGPEKVPADSLFVIGDFRSQSARDAGPAKKRKGWGVIPLETVKGKARWIWLSVGSQDVGAGPDPSAPRFPSFRFDRMLRRIE